MIKDGRRVVKIAEEIDTILHSHVTIFFLAFRRRAARIITTIRSTGGGNEMDSANGSIMTKSLTILEDQLKHEFLAAKKAEYYAGQFSDPQLGDLATRIAGEHRARYDKLLGYLNSHG